MAGAHDCSKPPISQRHGHHQLFHRSPMSRTSAGLLPCSQSQVRKRVCCPDTTGQRYQGCRKTRTALKALVLMQCGYQTRMTFKQGHCSTAVPPSWPVYICTSESCCRTSPLPPSSQPLSSNLMMAFCGFDMYNMAKTSSVSTSGLQIEMIGPLTWTGGVIGYFWELQRLPSLQRRDTHGYFPYQ